MTSHLLDLLRGRENRILPPKDFFNALGQSLEILGLEVQFAQIEKGPLPWPIGSPVGLNQLVVEVCGPRLGVFFSHTSNEHSVEKIAGPGGGVNSNRSLSTTTPPFLHPLLRI